MIVADLEQPGDLEVADELLDHECPVHADVELDEGPELNAYEKRWLDLACKDVAFHEDAVRHARDVAESDGLSDGRRAFYRGQARAALKAVKGIRAQMRRLLVGEPEPAGPEVDLWAR